MRFSNRGFGDVRGGGVTAGTVSFSPWNVTYNSNVKYGVLVMLEVAMEASLHAQVQQVFLHRMSPIIQMFK